MTESQLPATQTQGAQLPAVKNVPFIIPSSFAELVRYSELMAESDLVPKDFRGRPANVMLAFQWGIEIGLSPVQSLTSIAVINGRPGIFGDTAKALVEASPLCEYVKEEFERDSSGNITAAVCRAKRRGRPEQMQRFSVDDAKRAKLWGKEGPWTNYPPRMLQFRARSWALRDVFPDVLRGLGIVEELRDIEGEYTRIASNANASAAPSVSDTITLPRSTEQQPAQQRAEPSTDAGGVADATAEDAPSNAAEPSPSVSTNQAAVNEALGQIEEQFGNAADFGPGPDAEPKRTKPEPVRPLSDGQNRTLDATLSRHGLTRVDVRSRFGEVTLANLNDVLRWIPQRAAELFGSGDDAGDGSQE